MNVLKIQENFNLQYVNSLVQYWQNTRSFRCIGRPKGENLLLYLDGLSIVYTKKDGSTVIAHSGDAVYSPSGSEYRADLFDFRDEASHTVGINFLLTDEAGQSGVLDGDITVFRNASPHLSTLFHRVATLENSVAFLKKRSLVFEILSSLMEDVRVCSRGEIEPAVVRLTKYPEENLSVASLAELCGMSQVYFRKLFREEFGMAPAAYRNQLRLERAARYLEYGQITVQEISDTLGYGTASHFIKEFREAYGLSPIKYRKAFRQS
ncbi:MAG: helix-turn-helix transcriptional regulator [Ruminococcaceae bacterium]|nr:helix-turn-helix transcriptional regulator [Oscillospiraceae bacterium]